MEQGVGHWDLSPYTRDKDFLFSSFFVIFFYEDKKVNHDLHKWKM